MRRRSIKAEHTVSAKVYLSHQLLAVGAQLLCMLYHKGSSVECSAMAADSRSLKRTVLDAQRIVLFQPIALSVLFRSRVVEQIL